MAKKSKIVLKDVNKVYPGGYHAIHNFSLEIEQGEFIVFVGPSGCGKSTTLRMIAGLEDITSGSLEIEGALMNDVKPSERDIAMVFQSYALYPHMTVAENMGFGLKLQKVDPQEIKEKVLNAGEILGLTDYLDRKPKELSGGQRQRVALGRAIVRNPKVFLMDEPLSNLDAKLRGQTRSEIIKLHRRLNANTIYVTHDQIEAMTMADRIVIMKDGYIFQVGTPKEIHDKPDNMFVAGFIGTPPMNFILGNLNEDKTFEVNEKFKLNLSAKTFDIIKEYVGHEIVLGIRPEDIHENKTLFPAFDKSSFKMTVDLTEFLGEKLNVFGKVGDSSIIASAEAFFSTKVGEEIELAVDMEKIHFFDPKTQIAIREKSNKITK